MMDAVMLSPSSRLRDAETSLIARRHAQKGAPTPGDEADQALLAAIAALSPQDAPIARATGHSLGAHVYSRRFFEDTVPGAVAVLSTTLHASGAASLHLDQVFHRTARLRFEPLPGLAQAEPPVLAAFLEGAVEGFFSVAFNCQAHAATERAREVRLELGDGRNVNVRSAA